MEYQIIRSFRKSLAIEENENGKVIVRSPYFLSEKKISKIVESKSDLILKRIEKQKSLIPAPVISKVEIESLRRKAKAYILPKVKYWSSVTGLHYNNIKITSARGRFGSCSSKGNLCFSLFLMLANESEIDYVILHELCHLKQMNHSKDFYDLVSRFMPDYKERQKKLKKIKIPKCSVEKGIQNGVFTNLL